MKRRWTRKKRQPKEEEARSWWLWLAWTRCDRRRVWEIVRWGLNRWWKRRIDRRRWLQDMRRWERRISDELSWARRLKRWWDRRRREIVRKKMKEIMQKNKILNWITFVRYIELYQRWRSNIVAILTIMF